MGVGTERDSKGASESKVGEFVISFCVDEEVLRLVVAVEDSMGVTVVYPLDELIRLGVCWIRESLRGALR